MSWEVSRLSRFKNNTLYRYFIYLINAIENINCIAGLCACRQKKKKKDYKK